MSILPLSQALRYNRWLTFKIPPIATRSKETHVTDYAHECVGNQRRGSTIFGAFAPWRDWCNQGFYTDRTNAHA